MRLLTFLLTISFCCLASLVSARDEMRFERYTATNGSPVNRVTSMCEDSEGVVWMTTWNGLCSWDGKKLKSYVTTSDGQRFGRTGGLQVTKDGKLFFLNDADNRFCYDTKSGNLCPVPDDLELLPNPKPVFDYQEDATGLKFRWNNITYHIPYDEGLREEKQLHHVYVDKKGQLWFNFSNSLFRVWFESSPFHYFQQWPDNDSWAFKSTVRALCCNTQGHLMAASRNFHLYGVDSFAPIHLPGNVYEMVQDKQHRIWMALRKKGLFVCNDTVVTPALQDLMSVGMTDLFSLSLDADRNLLWAGTWGNGIRVLDINQEEPRIVYTSSNSRLSFVHRILPISGHRVCICTTDGLHVFSDSFDELLSVGMSMDVLDAVELQNGRILFCTNGKGMYWLSEDGSVEEDGILGIADRVTTMRVTSPEQLWLASDARLFRYNIKTKEVTSFDQTDFGEPVYFSEGTMTVVFDSLLYVGATAGIFEINLNQVDSYLSSRKQLLSDASMRTIVVIGVALLLVLVISVAVFLLTRRWMLHKQASTKVTPKMSLVESLNYVAPADREFVERLTTVLNDLIANPDADIMMISRAMRMSKNTLYVRCNEVLHQSPANILMNLRMDYALQLMDQGDRQIREVSFMVGFNDPKYFSKVFKSRSGVTPSQYQKKVNKS